jgi:hypothetical protein
VSNVQDGVGRRKAGARLVAWRTLPLALLVAISTLFAATAMVQADDTWIGLACGRHIVAHGVNDEDPFSFNSRPAAATAVGPRASTWRHLGARWLPSGWINQNWLTHVLLYELEEHFGYDSLIFLRFAVYLAAAACLWLTSRLIGVSPAACAVAIALAMVTARSLLEMRPQDLTNLLVTVEILLVVYSIRRRVGALWGVLPVLALWSNLHGGFIFGFIVLVVFALGAGLGRGWWLGLASVRLSWIRSAVTIFALALAAVVVLSPYHLANLTHPLLISVGGNASLWRFVAEWRPTFEAGLTSGEAMRFLVFLVVMGAAGVASLAASRRMRANPRRHVDAKTSAAADAAPFDLPLTTAVAIAVLMAVRSSRFIPIAVFMAAPVLGQWLDRGARFVLALASRGRGKREPSTVRPARIETALALAATVAVLLLGGYWGWRFANAYVAPWPHSLRPTSLFGRVTWADRRGFDACAFIRENRLAGRMYNNWVEGGTLEWCEEPDPITGRIPLQVYIDGRAQGAFPPAALERYLALEGGGPVGLRALGEGRTPTPSESAQIGSWIDAELAAEGVRFALLPEGDAAKPIMRGLLASESWQVVFLAPDHVLLADTRSDRGRDLYAGVFDGRTRFPDDFSRLLTRAYALFRRGDAVSAAEGFSDAVRAYSQRPLALAVQTARRAATYPELEPRLEGFARGVVEDYRRNLQRYLSEAGFLERNGAAVVAATYLRDAARAHGQNDAALAMTAVLAGMERERARVWRRAYW